MHFPSWFFNEELIYLLSKCIIDCKYDFLIQHKIHHVKINSYLLNVYKLGN